MDTLPICILQVSDTGYIKYLNLLCESTFGTIFIKDNHITNFKENANILFSGYCDFINSDSDIFHFNNVMYDFHCNYITKDIDNENEKENNTKTIRNICITKNKNYEK